ncbi:MAG: DUF58 domain-containing protein [Planctomycetota bacterium]
MFRYIRTRKLIERASLTPEGFVYLIVLCFITVGSVLRNVNLLILMAGMMYAPLFINWRLAVRRLRSFRAKRTLPKRIHANKLVSVQWECENVLPGIAAYNVVVDDQITRADEQTKDRRRREDRGKSATLSEQVFGELIGRIWKRKSDPNVSAAKVQFHRLHPNQPELQSYRAFFGQRGKYIVSEAAVSTSFPFGLIVSRNYLDQTETFFVAPELGRLEPTWEKRVQSIAVGSDSVRRSRAHEEDEFYALRPWRSGDSKKHIHWRTTARQGFPIVKQFDQQNNRDFALVLDLYASDSEPETKQRIETVLSFAATALLNIGRDVQGQVAISICGSDAAQCRSRSPQGMIGEAMPMLAVAEGSESPDLANAIVETSEFVSSGTPIYVISSRPRPESLDTPVESEVNENDHADTESRRVRHLARRLTMAMPLVRWLDVESEVFKDIFSRDVDRGEISSSFKELNAISQKWVNV